MRAFLENPLFVLWLTLIMDLADPGTFSEKLFLFWICMNPSNPWKGKLEVASFFAIYIHVQAV